MLSKGVPLRLFFEVIPRVGTCALYLSLAAPRYMHTHVYTLKPVHALHTHAYAVYIRIYNEWLAAMTLHGNVPSILGWYLVAPWLWLELQNFALKTTDPIFNILIAPNIVVVPLSKFAVEMATLMKSMTVSQSPDVRSASDILLCSLMHRNQIPPFKWLFSPGLSWLLSSVANKFTFSLHYNTYFHITTSHITVPDHTSLKCL